MKHKTSVNLIRVYRLSDLILTVLAFILACYIKSYCLPQSIRGLTTALDHRVILLVIIIIWYTSFSLFYKYEFIRVSSISSLSYKIAKLVTINMALLICCLYLLKITESVSRILFIIFYILETLMLVISRRITYHLIKKNHTKLYNLKNIIIVGSKQRAIDVIRALKKSQYSGYNIIGCLGIEDKFFEQDVHDGVKTLGTLNDYNIVLKKHSVDEVVFAVSLENIKNPETYIEFAEKMGITVRIIPDSQVRKIVRKTPIAHLSLVEFFGIPTFTFVSSPIYHHDSILVKSTIDYIGSVILIILLFPVFFLIFVLIKLTSKGPVIFEQKRSGLNGRIFKFYKFRTMIEKAEDVRNLLEKHNESDGPVFKMFRDPRTTSFGRFLRKTSLDELPQLFNVLRGEMSFVGPRPPIPSEVEKYETWQMRRLSMKPGLTCLWQILGRNRIKFDEWMALDLEYIDNWSLGLDLKILIKTFYVILKADGQ